MHITHPHLKNKTFTNLFFTVINILFIILLLSNLFCSNNSLQNDKVIISGVGSTLEEAAEIIKGVGGVFNSLKTMFSVISDIIGLRVIVLFIIVSIIGSGLSFLGIPKGKASFFCSLFIADIFWFIWIKNLSSDSIDLINRIWKITKTNLILVIPFILIYLINRKSTFRRYIVKLFSKFRPSGRNKKSLKRKFAVNITEKFQERSAGLHKSLFNDLMTQSKEDDIVLSPETLKQKDELEEILKEMK